MVSCTLAFEMPEDTSLLKQREVESSCLLVGAEVRKLIRMSWFPANWGSSIPVLPTPLCCGSVGLAEMESS